MAADGVSLDFQEQIAFLRRKVALPTERWDDLRHGAHVRAASVAGMTQVGLIQDVYSALERHAGDYEAFKASFDDLITKAGWKPRPRAGKSDEETRAWRAGVIYRTNMRTSYMAGRYQQMTDPDVLKARPYWRYRHNYARHPRPVHLALDGTVLLATNPWWRVWYPPNGWGCHCDVETLSERDLARLGKSGPDPTPAGSSYRAFDPRTGQSETRYPGIDRGWEYNVGEEAVAGLVPPELQTPLPPVSAAPAIDPAKLPALPPERPADPSRILPDGLADGEYIDAMLAEFGAMIGKPVAYRDASGGIVTLSERMFEQRNLDGETTRYKVTKSGRHRYLLLLADAIRDPDEIWASWARTPDGSTVLRRTYLRRTKISGHDLFASFAWTEAGWAGVTGYDAKPQYIARQRQGALLYRRGRK
ncbi:PBECR2 nuclease fold domain-containing protein [Segnochrobactrum spirostomi]|uniref:Phage head morphogenesis domain-containing protein n=1 Tax=Segnochrobactrum spirostomi TaxID=2608987 RepID=A0A6A7Y6E3_9HYPH|nr:PBECR2 nuclease fold domain-containing protein [Segnochrobactrum spirostomi]MQT13651.1 hypothetical protein [Segnochrobactrum spirostomi]